MTTLTTIQSTADNIDSAVDALAPIIGIFFPEAGIVKDAADALDALIDVALHAANAYDVENGGADAAIQSLQASQKQLQTALSDAQKLAKEVKASYPGDGSKT